MAGVQFFRKILFPTDFSEASQEALRYVVQLAIAADAELVILHAFRLITEGSDGEDVVVAKRTIEAKALEDFKKVDDELLKQSGLHYSFLSEVGFISDRIVSNVKNHQIDLLILCNNIQEKIKEKSEKGYNGLMQQVSCPIMLVPAALHSN